MAKPKESQALVASRFLLAALQAKHGGSACYSLSDHYKRHVVVPIPNLAVRHLIQSNGWPLASITSSSGPPKSLKSSFSFEVIRWYLGAGGAVLYIDTENKLSPTLLYSMVSEDYAVPPLDVLLSILKTQTTEEWQSGVSSRVEGLEDILTKTKKKPEFPTLVVVDSIGAAGSEAMSAAIAKDGNAPGKGFSDVAQLNTQFMRYLSSGQVGMPLTTHFVNHEKNRMDGSQGKVNPGGDALQYHTCLNLRFTPARQADRGAEGKQGAKPEFHRIMEDGTEIFGRNVSIKPTFNSFGSSIDADTTVSMMWRYDRNKDGSVKQVTWWDWDTSTANLVLGYAKALEPVLGKLERKKGDSNCIVTDVFGETSFAELGNRINSSEEILSKCTRAVSIPEHVVFEPGKMDCANDLERLESLKKSRKEEADKKKKGKAKDAPRDLEE